MIPNFFLIGAPKCGTTALATYLSEHENVFFCIPKEPLYWCSDFPKLRHEVTVNSLSEYLELFKNFDPSRHFAVGEGSTRYLRSQVAVRDILKFNPDARIIAMIRNPIEVVQAYHMEECYCLVENIEDFETAWLAQAERLEGKRLPKKCHSPARLQYGEIASFGKQVAALKDVVPTNQLLILVFDEFKENAGEIYRSTLAFLGLEDDGRMQFPILNAAHAHRYQWLASLVLHPPRLIEKPVQALRRHLWHKPYGPVVWVKSRLNRPKKRTPISDELRETLKAYFREDVERLSELVGRDLTAWTQ